MNQTLEQKPGEFVERRGQDQSGRPDGPERRQFTNDHSNERPEVEELARAVDTYKLQHRRRFITYAELYQVIESLGYHK